MKSIDFPERTHLIAEHQDEYVTLPALIDDGHKHEIIVSNAQPPGTQTKAAIS